MTPRNICGAKMFCMQKNRLFLCPAQQLVALCQAPKHSRKRLNLEAMSGQSNTRFSSREQEFVFLLKGLCLNAD